jgi:hypothetical protein
VITISLLCVGVVYGHLRKMTTSRLLRNQGWLLNGFIRLSPPFRSMSCRASLIDNDHLLSAPLEEARVLPASPLAHIGQHLPVCYGLGWRIDDIGHKAGYFVGTMAHTALRRVPSTLDWAESLEAFSLRGCRWHDGASARFDILCSLPRLNPGVTERLDPWRHSGGRNSMRR